MVYLKLEFVEVLKGGRHFSPGVLIVARNPCDSSWIVDDTR